MESALSWIGAIADWVGQWIPKWVIVDTTYGAVKWVGGSRIVPLGPGVHFYWPARTVFKMYPIARQAANLPTQTLTTKDDKTIVVGGLIVYEIRDIEAILAHTFDPEQTIKDIAMSALPRAIVSKTWEEIKAQSQSGQLERALRIEVKRELGKYGVKVLKTTLTDLALARVYKVMQSTAVDGV